MPYKKKADPVIMQALLDEPSVKPYVKNMTKGELLMFKTMLVKQGTYDHYAFAYNKKKLEAQKAELKEAGADLADAIKPKRKRHKKKKEI